jgi:hypothetical protein
VFDQGEPTLNIRSSRLDRSAMDRSKTGITNLGSDTSRTQVGATADYSTLIGGDQNSAMGKYSLAGGRFNVALGTGAVVFGDTCVASGAQSFATGMLSTASGPQSIAMGVSCSASQQSAVALGAGASASGYGSVSLGTSNLASGLGSFAAGYINVASGVAATALGQANVVSGSVSFAVGEDNVTEPSGKASTVSGHFNIAKGRASFVTGNRCMTGPAGDTAFASGDSAYAPRPTQWVHASGNFTDNDEGLHHMSSTGQAQTSLVVLRGETRGLAAGETTSLRYGGVHAPLAFTLEDDRAYTLTATCTVAGRIGRQDAIATLTRRASAMQRAGTAYVIDQDSTVRFGSTNALSWDIVFSAPRTHTNDMIELAFSTGTTTAATRVACKLEFTEVLFPVVDPLEP